MREYVNTKKANLSKMIFSLICVQGEGTSITKTSIHSNCCR